MEDSTKPRITRRSPLRLGVKLCPRCLSKLLKGSKLGGWLIPEDYYCPKCGYKGYVFVEKLKDEENGLDKREDKD